MPTLEDPVEWMDYFKDKPVVGSAAGPAVVSAVDDPHFRLPTQPKVVAGWGGTGEVLDPHVLVEGEGEGTGTARHDTEGVGGGGEDTPGGKILSPGADEGSRGKKADSEEKKEGKKEKKKKRKTKGKKRSEAGGSAQNSMIADKCSTEDEEDQPRTVERRIYRRQKTRKLRKLNNGGKLEMVQVKSHNSSDYSDMVLRPKGRKRSKNERGRRVITDGILECEGGRLVP